MDRSFALVKFYGMDREERSLVSWSISSRQGEARFVVLLDRFRSAPTAQQPALETQPREDIRRCRGDDLGVGAGTYNSVLTAFTSHEEDAVLMGWLYASFAFGGAIAPLIVGGFVAHGIGWNKFYIILLTLSNLLGGISLVLVGEWEVSLDQKAGSAPSTTRQPEAENESEHLRPAPSATARLCEALHLKIVWMGLLLIGLTYGSADALAAWTSSYFLDVKHASKSASKYLTSGLWGGCMMPSKWLWLTPRQDHLARTGMAVGRLILPWLFRGRVRERTAAIGTLTVAIVMLTVMWFVESFKVAAVALAFAGFSAGPMTPHVLSMVTSRLPATLKASVVSLILGTAVLSGGGSSLLFGLIVERGWISTLPPCLIVASALAACFWALVPPRCAATSSAQ
ncbi:BZ3500_MvSof-1268-A1-R1_Chr1-1g01221 [Microbotryum saponariae]|uniref:BZ3500_MvSof-1268-A1-R1_Chr1-1g01221 protein n=1 Tax=Microbotryum saponariae TaxID=289078 RepID=A0A2X0KTI4_9BASI|nr:BZ3500_MvSof-1268-A1-R1_Chr1-1g01221 [Microbotryum saponariae]SCZ93708.1 BZ3501_MvSof-1269-A2-R1_Chr1-1g00817 [Microbotryum saponariae]